MTAMLAAVLLLLGSVLLASPFSVGVYGGLPSGIGMEYHFSPELSVNLVGGYAYMLGPTGIDIGLSMKYSFALGPVSLFAGGGIDFVYLTKEWDYDATGDATPLQAGGSVNYVQIPVGVSYFLPMGGGEQSGLKIFGEVVPMIALSSPQKFRFGFGIGVYYRF